MIEQAKQRRRAVVGASIGTLFEWYDFNLYVLLAVPIGANFFAGASEPARALFALLVFAAGFLVRPLGALLFGRIGDKYGRKTVFLVTIIVMGIATVLVGVLPTYAEIGVAAAAALVVLRMLQGLAVGGEYGGAAVYLAEHVPPERRGFYTSFIQATITVATLLALLLILAIRAQLTPEEFMRWGWRIPFLLAVVPLVFSIWLRLRLAESPIFAALKRDGNVSAAPIRETIGSARHLRLMAIVLFGLVAGQAALAYGGHVYPFVFMQTVLKVDFLTATILHSWALAIAAIGFVAFGWLADRIGAIRVIVAGFALGVATYFPLYDALVATANPELHAANRQHAIAVRAPSSDCSFQFNPVGTARFAAPCDVARAVLTARGAAFVVRDDGMPGTRVDIAGRTIEFDRPGAAATLGAELDALGYRAAGRAGIVKAASLFDIWNAQALTVIAIIAILALYGSMAYAPLAALLVELFPARVRTTALSIPYNLGNGWVGGLLPASAFALVVHTGDPLSGLWYPVGFAAISLVVCWRWMNPASIAQVIERRGGDPY